ncbi:DNA-binding SARP family transcriptional activator [Arthrobacter sp. SLBN-100]|uniref:AfsR/SARP family transcriptional regulator n=1 Tax=Arthrobacter sp. SLBN-100 TaxID=2768450 RepID=UPI001151D38C|nr:BTAD domain-containing putative transcriptional regulator [Arthrobacter sp. SLBN-100]TQJ67752.1 DNA-binding SARP family transcriptional activator [Arthrobacter sp. SLBN-100]
MNVGRNGEPGGGAALDLRLLGDFRLGHGESTVELAPRAEHLLAFLALRNNMTRTAVAAQLWPDLDEAQARGCLRSTLWRLPRPDGLTLVVASGDRLYLTTFVQVDVTRLREGLDQWLPGDSPPVQIGPLSGDLLPGWYDDWLVIDRERQRQVRLHALERMSAWYVGAERFDRAIEAALQAIAGDPLRESAHRCLIQAHLAEGNISEARRQVDIYRSLLAEAGIPAQLSARMHELMRPARVMHTSAVAPLVRGPKCEVAF